MTRKAKRKLSDISFEKEGAHIALTHKDQGYSANGEPYALVLKASYSEEIVQKMQQVQVTLELPDFLHKFFNLYYEDAEVLARFMGYVPEEKDDKVEYSYEDYIQEKLQSFTVLKALKESDDVVKSLTSLTGEQHLQLLLDQKMIEKALSNSEGSPSEEGKSVAVVKNKAEDLPSGKKETNMDEKEMVEKSALESLQKSLDDTKVELQKALDALAVVEAEKKEAVRKSKSDKISAIVKNTECVEAVVKAALALDSDEDFNAFVAAVTKMTAVADSSDLFVEKGASTSEEAASAESGVAKLLKAQHSKQ